MDFTGAYLISTVGGNGASAQGAFMVRVNFAGALLIGVNFRGTQFRPEFSTKRSWSVPRCLRARLPQPPIQHIWCRA